MTATVGNGADRIWLRRSALRDAAAVVRMAFVVLRRHWPVLLTLSFLGQAARLFIREGAVRLSHVNTLAGVMLFILVPIATLCALTLMIWTARASLPTVSTLARSGRLLNMVGAVLIPFLAVYASYGYVRDDWDSYLYDAMMSRLFEANDQPIRVTIGLVTVVAVTVGLRALLGRWSWATGRGWVGFIRAYLEVTWITVGAFLVLPATDNAKSWLTNRQAVYNGTTTVDHVKTIGAPVRSVVDLLESAFGSTDTVIVVPLAWLAVGAIIYGGTIEEDGGRIAAELSRRWDRLPKLLRRLLSGVRNGIKERLDPLINGVRVLLRSGLTSMLLFCLLFLVVQSTSIWLFMLERVIIGPRDMNHFWLPLYGVSGAFPMFNNSIQMVFLVCLMAAAVDRVIRPQTEPAEPAPTETGSTETDALSEDTSPLPAVLDGPTAPQELIRIQG